MKRDNFVSRLTESEFLEFAINAGIVTKNYVVSDISYCDDNDGSDVTAIVKYKRSRTLFKSKNEEKKIVYVLYTEFSYLISISTFDTVTGNNKLWRSFVANKIGYDYISAYERYVSEWIDGRRRGLVELENRFKSEIEDYNAEIEKLKEQMM